MPKIAPWESKLARRSELTTSSDSYSPVVRNTGTVEVIGTFAIANITD